MIGTFKEELTAAMTLLGQHPRSVFLGQAIAYPGTAMTSTFVGVPRDKLIELPVMEDCQLGLAIGMSLNGDLPICIYPRINFLLLAINQLILHLDAIPRYSAYRPKVIIRTAIATNKPLNPGAQHLGDFVPAIREMLSSPIDVLYLNRAEDVAEQYNYALNHPFSSILVEHSEMY